MLDKVNEVLVRRWRLVVVIAWLLYAAWYLFDRWGAIHAFALGDTDDNLRLAQVRALLDGQRWFDLRQHRLDPLHGGANIHWSRLVDLPIAGLILGLRPLFGGIQAERWASAFAPLIPLLPMLGALALITRRLVDPRAAVLALAALLFAGSTAGMVQPLRIDHHGWQLALLAVSLAGLADPRRARGGVIAGVASALSLTIGLELIIYAALIGVAQVLFWVVERDERRRLVAYAASLSGGTALGFLLFASDANRGAVCDALSSVWLSDALLGGGLIAGLAMLRVEKWTIRLGLAAAAGIVLAAFHALAFPHCLSRLEGVSPEATQLWLSHVKEARPIYRHGAEVAALTMALPISGLIGYALLVWRARGEPDLLRRTLAVAAPAFTALALLMWQTRTGPAAQMMAIPGSVAIVFILAPRAFASNNSVVRVLGTVLAVVAGLGALVPLGSDYFPKDKVTALGKRVAIANRRCPTLAALRPIARQPKGTIFTFVDFGPRIIAMTHHDAIAGPYHRNYPAIVDSMLAFRGDAAQAHRIVADKYHADYLMICPDQSSATIFMAEAPKGFYVQLARGEVPAWLAPVDLGPNSPWKMWRVVG
ncbi:MAG: AcrB/AcrD/AcrF family protein [Sphingomicrobium sp.]